MLTKHFGFSKSGTLEVTEQRHRDVSSREIGGVISFFNSRQLTIIEKAFIGLLGQCEESFDWLSR